MAKTKEKEADEVEEGLGIDLETKEMLENEVKKGKARKFILICKGAQIKQLIVFKKGPYHTRIQKARKDGFKGDAFCGIVNGSGVNLTFQLAGNKEVADAIGVDGAVDGEPTKTAKLKEFLNENDLARKPEYEIVRDPKAVTNPETDENGAPVRSDGAATAAVGTSAPAQPSGDGAATPTTAAPPADDAAMEAKCKQLKAAILPRIKDAVAADPDKKEEIVRLLESASQNEKQASFGKAFEFFKDLGQKVKEALSQVGDKPAYDTALPGAELKVKTLKEHAQSAVIKTELETIEGYLKKAKEQAAKNDFTDACKQLAKIDKEYPAAKRAADNTKLGREIEADMRLSFNNFEQHQGIGAIEPAKVKEVKDKFPDLDSAIKSRDWAKFDATSKDMRGKMAAFKTTANRHGDYVGLRNNSLQLVAALEAHPNKDAITADIAKIKTDLIEKAKTEYDTNKKYEDARDLLLKVEPAYDSAKTKADTKGADEFKKQRDAAAVKLTALDKPPANAPIAAEIAAIKAKLAKADGYAGAKQFPDAGALIAEVTKDVEAAEKVAAQHTGFSDAEKAAADATGKISDKDRKTAVDAVQKLHDQLKKHTHEAAIRTELGDIQKKIDQAKAA